MTQELLKHVDEMIESVIVSELGFFQDNNYTIDLSVKTEDGEDSFFVRRNGAVLYAGPDGAKAASQFYSQIAQVHEDDQNGADPDFATLREILEARNQHVKEALSQLGHTDLARSLSKLTFKSIDNEWHDIFFSPDATEEIIKGERVEKLIPAVIGAALGAVGQVAGTVVDAATNVEASDPDETKPKSKAPKVGGVDKSVSDNLIYTEDDRSEEAKDLESPANFDEAASKPNLIMRQELENTSEYQGVFFFIKNSFEELLFVKRTGAPYWELPGGLKKEDESLRDALKRQIALLNLKARQAKQLGSVSMGEGHVSGMIFAVSVSGQIVLPDKYDSLTWVSVGSLANVPLAPDYNIDELKDMITTSMDDPEDRLYLSTNVSNDIYKQRDITDLGDPFQSVGDNYVPPGVRGSVVQDGVRGGVQAREIGDNLKHLRNQVGLKHHEESEGVFKYPDNNPIPEGEDEDLDPGREHVEEENNPYLHKSRDGSRQSYMGLRQSYMGLRQPVNKESPVWETETDSEYVEKFDTQGWDPGHPETINDSRMQPRGIPQERLSERIEKGEDEGIGAKRTLVKVNEYSKRLIDILGDNEEIDFWVLDKISRTGSYMSDIYHHLTDSRKLDVQQKAYPFTVDRPEDMQDPISAQRKKDKLSPASEEALSSAEAGTGTQAFSSGAVVDLPESMDAEIGVQPHAVQGSGSEGVEGGGDGSIDMIPTPDASMNIDEAEKASEFDSRLRSLRKKDPLVRKDTVGSYDDHHHDRLSKVNTFESRLVELKEGGGDGGGGGSFGGDGGSGTAMTSGGTHTATYGGGGTSTAYDSSLKPKSAEVTKSDSDKEEEKESEVETIFENVAETVDSSLEKNADVYGTTEGLSQLPAPDVPELGQTKDPKKSNSIDRHRPGDSESRRRMDGRGVRNEPFPPGQEPIGDDVSNLVIAENEDTYKPAELEERAENEIVRRKFIDEDSHRIRTNDMAAEQYTNLSYDTRLTPENQLGDAVSGVVATLLSPMLAKSGDDPSNIDVGLMKVLVPDGIEKQTDFMDTKNTLVVAGWGNYYVIDQEGHRIGIEGMRRALEEFLKRPEYANVNIFHSGIQVGQILPEFTDEHGKLWKTEVRPEGMFVVAAIRNDLEVARKAMREIMKGTLRGFSIAGNAKDKELKCDHGKCWTEVTDMEMYEVTLCVQPMNQNSYITDILQMPDAQVCPDCYEGVQVEYDSNLNIQGVSI